MDDEEVYEPDFGQIAAALADSPVYVDPSISDTVSADDIATLTALIDDIDGDVYILAVPLPIVDAEWTAAQFAAVVSREAGGTGTYIITQVRHGGNWESSTHAVGVTEDRELRNSAFAATQFYPADLGRQLVETMELHAAGEGTAARDEIIESYPTQDMTRPEDESEGFLPIDGWLVGALGMAALITAVAVWRQRRSRRRALALSRRAVSRISDAQAVSWRRRAESAHARLGDRIGQHEIGEGSDRGAWEAALDHYDVAGEVLARSDDAADAIGAFIVAERGLEALEAAVEDRAWTPTGLCFFNPLHGDATTEVPWRTDAGSIDAPACSTCEADIQKRRQEPEFLDLPLRGRVVHYTEAEAEPWSSTGYGSLDEDLIGAWRRRG